jgi:hypothetical protein
MNETLRSELDSILASYNRRKQEILSAELEQAAKDRAVLRAFGDLLASTIRPTAHAVGEYLKSRGMDYRVEMIRLGLPHVPTHDVGIGILLELGEARFEFGEAGELLHSSEYPGLSIVLSPRQQLVYFRGAIPGRDGASFSAGTVSLAAVTSELIETKMVGLLREILR